MSDLLKNFNSKLERRFSKFYAGQTTLDWCTENTTLGGLPFSTKGYEFQNAILNDDHPNMDVIKCSQIGLTEIQIRKALAFVSRNRRVAAIFTLPDEKLFKRVAQTRILPMVERDRIFNLEQDENSVRSMSIIQCDHSFLYVTGCTESDATSTAADAVYNDELDLSDAKMIALFQSRLQNSDMRINQRFSTPTFQAFGIDSGYKASDQHRYLQKCDCCGHWNWPEFNTKFCYFPDLPKHIEDLMEIDADVMNEMDLSQCYVRCEKCLKPLTGERQWVATFPGRTQSRGYHVTPFSTDRIGLPYIVEQLVKYKARDFIRGFHNTVLGQTYSDARTQIPLECIEQAMLKGSPLLQELPKDRGLVLGCDMGQTCHLTIGSADGKTIYRMEAVPIAQLPDRIKFLKENYRIVAGAVDRLPYTPTADAIRDMSRNVIMPVQYAITKDADVKLVLDGYGVISHAAVNRTKILDEVANDFRNYVWELNGYGHQKQVVIEHLRDMVRDEKPETLAVWLKLSGNDHYFHSLALFRAALKLRPLVIEHQSEGVHEQWGFLDVTIGNKQDGLPGYGGGFKPRESLNSL